MWQPCDGQRLSVVPISQQHLLTSCFCVTFLEMLPYFKFFLFYLLGFPCGSVVKNLPASTGDLGSIPGPGRSLEKKWWQPTPVLVPETSHWQRSLVSDHGVAERAGHDVVIKQEQWYFLWWYVISNVCYHWDCFLFCIFKLRYIYKI